MGAQAARAAAGGEAVLQGLRAATNYSVSVRARSERGAGPPSPPALCRTRDDGDDHSLTAKCFLNAFEPRRSQVTSNSFKTVPSAPELIRALPAGPDAVRVSWVAPAERGGRLTHYTLYTRELGKYEIWLKLPVLGNYCFCITHKFNSVFVNKEWEASGRSGWQLSRTTRRVKTRFGTNCVDCGNAPCTSSGYAPPQLRALARPVARSAPHRRNLVSYRYAIVIFK